MIPWGAPNATFRPALTVRWPEEARPRKRQLVLWAALVLSLPLADMASHCLPLVHADVSLVPLIRLMAGVKMGMAAVASCLVERRLRFDTSRRLAFGYCATVLLMNASGDMFLHPSHLLADAVLFHAGLLLFLALAYFDRAGVSDMAGAWRDWRTTFRAVRQ